MILYFTLQTDEDFPNNEVYSWADGLVLVFAITDRNSFNYVRHVKQELDSFNSPGCLVANKADMVHLRQVSTEEGKCGIQSFPSRFCEKFELVNLII